MNTVRRWLLLFALAACSAQAEIVLPGDTSITNPLPNQLFPANVSSVACGWTAASDAFAYTLKIIFDDSAYAVQNDLEDLSTSLPGPLTPGYYTLLVQGTNAAGPGPWSSAVTFIVTRTMTPSGTVSSHPPRTFKWTRNTGATRYKLQLAQYDNGLKKYVVKRSYWIAQPATGLPTWKPAYAIPDGKYRWTVTDYKRTKKGYSQSALFQVKNSGDTNWNDPALITGSWKVVTDWRWVEMTFRPDGVIVTKQANGQSFTRAHWSATDTILTMVSDVTEKCPYTVTDNTLTFTLPSGSVKNLTRLP